MPSNDVPGRDAGTGHGGPAAPAVAQDGEERVLLLWEARVRALTNPVVFASVFLCFAIPACLLGILMAAVTRSLEGLLMGVVPLAILMVIFLLVGLVIDLFGGFRFTFVLTTDGVRGLMGHRATGISTAVAAAGVLAGSLTVAGAGLLARSERDVFIPYGEVTKVKVSGGRRYILVRGSNAPKPIGLYCKPENFEPVLAILRERCPGAQFLGRSLPIF